MVLNLNIMKSNSKEVEPNILGYSGYVWGIKAENLFGKSRSYLCKIVKNDVWFKNRDLLDESAYKST